MTDLILRTSTQTQTHHRKFRSNESYMHYYAKDIVQDWLISAWKFNKKNGYDNKLYIFDWKIDRSDKNHGIRIEYPILSKVAPNGTKLLLGFPSAWVTYPDLDNLGQGIKIEAVLDLAIIEDKCVKYGIEIVHKHICGKAKRDFIKTLSSAKVYELSAEWVLSQILGPVPPKCWPCYEV